MTVDTDPSIGSGSNPELLPCVLPDRGTCLDNCAAQRLRRASPPGADLGDLTGLCQQWREMRYPERKRNDPRI